MDIASLKNGTLGGAIAGGAATLGVTAYIARATPAPYGQALAVGAAAGAMGGLAAGALDGLGAPALLSAPGGAIGGAALGIGGVVLAAHTRGMGPEMGLLYLAGALVGGVAGGIGGGIWAASKS